MSRATYKGEPMFPSEYLAEPDLKGKEVTLLVENVVPEDLRQKDNSEKACYIMTFKGTPKKFVVKPTNADLIVKATGAEESLDWIGHRITLYPTTCYAFGDPNTPCIRVKSRTNQPKQSPPAEQDSPGANSEPESESASGSGGNLKLITDILGKDVVTKQDVNNAGMLTGLDGEEPVQDLIAAGEFRAAVEMMAELFRGE